MPDTPEKIERPLWNCLTTQGDAVECTVTTRHGGVSIEGDDGLIHVEVYARDDGVDVRVHDVQLVVKKRRVTLMQQHGPYPINEWTILWEGHIA